MLIQFLTYWKIKYCNQFRSTVHNFKLFTLICEQYFNNCKKNSNRHSEPARRMKTKFYFVCDCIISTDLYNHNMYDVRIIMLNPCSWWAILVLLLSDCSNIYVCTVNEFLQTFNLLFARHRAG